MRPIDADRLLWVLDKNYGHTGGAAVMRQLIDIQPTLTPQNEWVSVEERLPDELKMVLVYCRGLYDVAGWVKDEEDKICWTCKTEPEFWRPIPELDG